MLCETQYNIVNFGLGQLSILIYINTLALYTEIIVHIIYHNIAYIIGRSVIGQNYWLHSLCGILSSHSIFYI